MAKRTDDKDLLKTTTQFQDLFDEEDSAGDTSPEEMSATRVLSRTAIIGESHSDDDLNILEGMTIKPQDKYRFRRSLGQGGMKTILQVRDGDTRREVAMAVIADADDRPARDIRRFIQEARITAKLEHPNIVPVHDIGIDSSGAPYFTMKLLRGETLQEILNKLREGSPAHVKRYDLPRLLRTFLRICNAVAFAHSRGVVHLDLKPENIQVGQFGEVQVMDWGLAKFIGDEQSDDFDSGRQEIRDLIDEHMAHMTLDGMLKGTPGYMAPEQAAGRNSELDERTDIYALGCILYSMLTHVSPIETKDLQEILENTITGNILSPKERRPDMEIPSTIAAVANKAMSLNPAERYQQVEDIRTEIYAYMGGFTTEAERASIIKRTALLIRRHRLVFSSLVVIMLLIASFGGYALYNVSKQSGDWIKVYEKDFRTSFVDPREFKMTDRYMRRRVTPWRVSQDGLEMVRHQWMWIRDVSIKENTRVVARIQCNTNPEALEVCINSRPEPVRRWWFTPVGYSFQFGAGDGRRDAIFKNESPSPPDVIATVQSSFTVNNEHVVVFERVEETLSMWVDGVMVLAVSDLFPPRGAKLESIGLRSFSSSMRLMSLNIYRQALPEKASPLIAGDALVEAGHFRDAVDKYLKIAENYGTNAVAEKALSKAYLTASTQLPSSLQRDVILLDIKKKLTSLFPQSTFRETMLELEVLQHWRSREFLEAFSLLPEVFQLNPRSNVVLQILQCQHYALPEEVAKELLSWIAKSKTAGRLNLSNLGIRSLEQLEGLDLTYLDCSGNDLKNLKGIEGMQLAFLSCSRNQLQNLRPLVGMQLEDLDCSRNKITDIDSLRGMPLKSLDCSHNRIEDLRPLAGMSLEKLNIAANKIQSLEPLSDLPLEMLDISDNEIATLKPLNALTLEMLICNNTQIDSIEPLQYMPLRILELLNCNKLNDLTSLSSVYTLEQLAFPKRFKNVGFLRHMPNLKYLSNKRSIVDAETPPTAEEFWAEYEAEHVNGKNIP